LSVRQPKYCEPPTPGGLEAIDKGTLQWFDTEMYGNLNTGVLEQYLDEKNRRESFERSTWNWGKVLVAMAVGTIFAAITEYVALKIGMGISAVMYIIYLSGMALRWKPSEINIVAAAADAASMVSMGFIFSYPAIYLLKYSSDFAIGTNPDGSLMFLVKDIPPIWIAIIASILSGWLGTVYFVLFRRLWLVEDPLHVPGFEPNLKLLDIANDIKRGGAEQAARSIRIVSLWSIGTALFTFFRDMPVINKKSVLDNYFGGAYYKAGEIMQPESSATYTFVSFTILPIQIGVGWFMRFKVALLMCLGTFLTWFVIVPLAVGNHVPIYDVAVGGFKDVASYDFASWMAYRKIAVIIGIGALLGGGFTAMAKMAPMFRSLLGDVMNAVRPAKDAVATDYLEGKGWYDWPISHIVVVAVLAPVTIAAVLLIAGFPVLETIIFSILLLGATFVFSAIAVKTLGETGTTPVSATSILVLIILIMVFKFGLNTSKEVAVIISLLGTTIFCGAISLSASIIFDFKLGIYVGNRPYHLMKSVLVSTIPGAVVSALAAGFLSYQLATGKLDLIAPQARVFATLTQLFFAGQSNDLVLQYMVIGAVIGVFMELMSGMGTAFGLGMYFPLSIQLPMLLGGALRDMYEKAVLEPRAKAEGWSERKRTLATLDTYMGAAGLMIGEPVMAMVAAFVAVTMG
jgi:putative OPT family oligopeptide transporter